MSGNGKYWDEPWNPIAGCTGCVSAGTHGDRCWACQGAPLHWHKPRVVATCWRGDLFHERVPDEWIDRVYAVMAACPQHTFLVLTKRSERRRRWVADERARRMMVSLTWPLPNVWEGASACDQGMLDEQWAELARTPAAHRWLSLEPLLGTLRLCTCSRVGATAMETCKSSHGITCPLCPWLVSNLSWVVTGGETGPGARPCHPDWVRQIRDQCAAAGVPFFLKSLGQWGAPTDFYIAGDALEGRVHHWPQGGVSTRILRGGAGRLLDGREYNEVPWGKEEEARG